MNHIMKQPHNDCKGTKSLFGEGVTGGHMEDYITDPNNAPDYRKYTKMEWVPVWKSMKSEGMSLR